MMTFSLKFVKQEARNEKSRQKSYLGQGNMCKVLECGSALEEQKEDEYGWSPLSLVEKGRI